MIGYVILGTNDLARATAFYDALFAAAGGKRLMSFERGHAWGTTTRQPLLGILTPFDGRAATVGNGVMVALLCPDRAAVDRLHAKALELGGTDEGKPGERFPGFYAGYFRDLDGNKLNFFVMGPDA
ncbi:MAG: VOC family protein [Armatimonadota bacterium]|nr:VOC family protein [Armatimonadota bacterium]